MKARKYVTSREISKRVILYLGKTQFTTSSGDVLSSSLKFPNAPEVLLKDQSHDSCKTINKNGKPIAISVIVYGKQYYF